MFLFVLIPSTNPAERECERGRESGRPAGPLRELVRALPQVCGTSLTFVCMFLV